MFGKKKHEGHKSDENVRMESSICTGEKIIGFERADGGLELAEVVRSQADIDAFYKRHDLKKTKEFNLQ